MCLGLHGCHVDRVLLELQRCRSSSPGRGRRRGCTQGELPLFYVFRGKDTASFFVIVVLFVAINAVFAVIMISSDNGIGFAESADKLISKLPLICLALLAVDIVTFFVSWRISTSLLRKCDK